MKVVLDTRITWERKTVTKDAEYRTDIVAWTLVATVWCEAQDEMPSRAEALKAGVVVARNRTRIRYRYRTDIDSSMRGVIVGPVRRVLGIIGGPAMVGGNRQYSEVMCEELST